VGWRLSSAHADPWCAAMPLIRLVACDVDGTLLDHDGTLPAARADAALALTRAGLPIVLATGKLWSSVAGLIDRLELPGPHVTCNGSVVIAPDGTRHAEHLLDAALADEVVATLRHRALPYAVYLADGSLISHEVATAHDVLPLLGEPLPTVAGREGRGVIKVLAMVTEEAEGDLRELGTDLARVQRTNPRFLEWNARAADKATGLAVVCELLGVPLSSVVAIGDAENDVPMLRAAGCGVAVTEASAAAIAAADRHLDVDVAAFLRELTPATSVVGAPATAPHVTTPA
jgi:5-amino-6-(5-phospho-D-ribitylamino)uracil phosphatase